MTALATAYTRLNLLGAAPIEGRGNNLANTISGNSGNNRLNGLGGNDVISGGLGADTFRFASPLNAATNRDQIVDFNPAQGDRIELENGIFTALATTGPLAASAFTILAATTAAQRIVYNPTNGNLTYDTNGSSPGGTTVFATLPTGLTLTSSDFIVS